MFIINFIIIQFLRQVNNIQSEIDNIGSKIFITDDEYLKEANKFIKGLDNYNVTQLI